VTYKYYKSGSPTFFSDPKQKWVSGYNAFVDQQFSYASDYYIIQEEAVFTSGSLTDIGVRIKRSIDSGTGAKLGDDFKTIVFQDTDHTAGIGYKYYFNDNYWLATHSEIIKGITNSITVQRCNSVLRWVDSSGNSFSEPCVINYDINRASDMNLGKNMTLPEGFIRLYSQLNDNSTLIKEGQRFLIGRVENRVCYAVYGGGKRNFLNQETLDDSSGNLLQLILGVGMINDETDDIINGIADRYKVVYDITTVPTSITANASETFQVTSTVTRNDIVVEEDVIYSTSASSIAIVSGSGLITTVTTGSCVITAIMENNILVSGSIPVIISGTPIINYEVRVDPNSDYLLQGDTTTYSVFLYKDSVLQSDTFAFTIANSNVPASSYTFTAIDDNNFSIKNNALYMADTLDVDCVSGSQSRQLNILLKGSW